jgi:hypothetical protein
VKSGELDAGKKELVKGIQGLSLILINDDSIDLIVVSTQHNSHAKFVVEALNAGNF